MKKKPISPEIFKDMVNSGVSLESLKHSLDTPEEESLFYAKLNITKLTLKVQKDKSAILEGIYLCGYAGIPMPDWLVESYSQIYDDYKGFKYKSLDEAFGLKEITQLNANRKRHELPGAVYLAVKYAHDELGLFLNKKSTSVENAFKYAADIFNISTTEAENHYYEIKNWYEDQ